MNYRDFKAAIAIEDNEPRDYEQIVFRTPDGTTYSNVKVEFSNCGNSKDKVILVDLFNIEPIFKVGDVVTNISGLYPNVRCTITTVDKEKQCYYFREVTGITYFKDQDKLILANDEKVTPPVEDEDKLDILAKAHANNVKYNVLKYNIEHYPLIYNVLKQIIATSKLGAVSYHIVVGMKKEIDKDYEAGFYYKEDEICGIIRWHFDKLGYKIEEKVKDNYNEFFITW